MEDEEFKLRKLYTLEGYDVFLVDGSEIRSNVEIEFTNFGHHGDFPDLIPEKEIWIDDSVHKAESGFFVIRAILEDELFSKGLSRDAVIDEADEFEKTLREHYGENVREIDPFVAKMRKLHVMQDGTEIWTVNGDYVREPPAGNINFTEGAHWLVPHNEFIPEGEIWIEDGLSEEDLPFVLIHEIVENLVMRKKSISYEGAHTDFASPLEEYARQNPEEVEEIFYDLGF